MANQLWFRHPRRCWALGDIKQLRGATVDVKDVQTGELRSVALNDTHPGDPSHHIDTDDIAHMNNIHEGPLLALLERRYGSERIYTYTGDILISLNPYKLIPRLYDITEPPPEGAEAPDGAAFVDLPDYADPRTPHVFTVAERAYRTMLDEANPSKRNQSLIVSGESGAGKTEACKYVMRYLAALSKRDAQQQTQQPEQPPLHPRNPAALAAVPGNATITTAAAATRYTFPPSGSLATPSLPHISIPPFTAHVLSDNGSFSGNISARGPTAMVAADSIETKVLECNPFLEAFGNAKTLRNDNSSRFGGCSGTVSGGTRKA